MPDTAWPPGGPEDGVLPARPAPHGGAPVPTVPPGGPTTGPTPNSPAPGGSGPEARPDPSAQKPGDTTVQPSDAAKPGDAAQPTDPAQTTDAAALPGDATATLPKPVPGDATVTLPAVTPAVTPGHGGQQSKGFWDVDPDKLHGFSIAVSSARFGLAAVQTRVTNMQGEAYTPKLGTSPVGQQLAKKFDDRLNGEEGLRGLLKEAMTRMDQFIKSAEQVRDAYRDVEDTAEGDIKRTDRTGGAA
ncbi:hypothetical protein Acsp05_71980 [Actinokineospora sp. NBRC 105648]|nr:hypothetical protein Acsp05_71980 [Actinokineospora sp. NBRC 105648]